MSRGALLALSLMAPAFWAACATEASCACPGACDVDLASDPDHCGGCGRACEFPNASRRCAAGRCVMGACDDGFVDLDGDERNGCERPADDPVDPSPPGEGEGDEGGDDPAAECPANHTLTDEGCLYDERRCDGVDDDGDRLTDEGRCEAVILGDQEFHRGQAGGSSGHKVTLPYDFAVDRFEVSVANYRRCLVAGGCDEQPACPDDGLQPGGVIDDMGDDEPVRCLSWCAAWDYCRWVGKRLPTDAESHRIIRGADGRTYPWGSSCPQSRNACRHANLANSVNCGCFREPGHGPWPDPVEAFSELRSTADGVVNAYGNVREWLHDWAPLTYGDGGSNVRDAGGDLLLAGLPEGGVKAISGDESWAERDVFGMANLETRHPALRWEAVGFRCARTLSGASYVPPSGLPPPLIPGTEDEVTLPDCELPDAARGCADTVRGEWRSLVGWEVEGSSPPFVDDGVADTFIEFLTFGIGLARDAVFAYSVEGGERWLGTAAPTNTCSPLSWFLGVPPARLVPNPEAEGCEGGCFVTAPGEPFLLYEAKNLRVAVPIRTVTLREPVQGRGRSRWTVHAEDLAEVEILGLNGADMFRQAFGGDLGDDGVAELEMSFAYEDTDGPPTRNPAACRACVAEER